MDPRALVPESNMPSYPWLAEATLESLGGVLAPALEQAWASVDMGGVVVLFTVPGPEHDVVVPVNDFWRKEIRILTSYYCGPPDIEEALDLIATGAVEVDGETVPASCLGEECVGYQEPACDEHDCPFFEPVDPEDPCDSQVVGNWAVMWLGSVDWLYSSAWQPKHVFGVEL